MTAGNTAIIFVPGIRPKPPAAEQWKQLQRCLRRGVLSAGGSVADADTLSSAFRIVGWSHQFYGEHADITVDIPGIERLLAGQDSVEEDRTEALSLRRRLNGTLYALADRFPGLTTIFASRRMETRVEEMQRYFTDRDGRATAARAMVAEALQVAWDRGQRIILIGHSFGSVIAYDTLWELSRRKEHDGAIDLFLTMGSPLTMTYIRTHLKGAHMQPGKRYPTNILAWVNLAALGEATALDRQLAQCFRPMLQRQLVASIEDDLELINQFHGPDGLNVHKCYGYMATPAVGRLLLRQARS